MALGVVIVSDYRDVSIEDAFKRIAYEYGVTEAEQTPDGEYPAIDSAWKSMLWWISFFAENYDVACYDAIEDGVNDYRAKRG